MVVKGLCSKLEAGQVKCCKGPLLIFIYISKLDVNVKGMAWVFHFGKTSEGRTCILSGRALGNESPGGTGI